ncbi:MAG TPA: hypothetical protein VGF69_01045 [Thermoanaerobaculia bacterium]|jgi:hypothetical protein
MSSVNTLPTLALTPEEAVQQLRALRDLVPEFVVLSPGESSRLASAATLDPEFVHASISAASMASPLQVTAGQTPEQMRVELELTLRWAAVVDEIDGLRAGIVGAIATRRHRLGLTALQVYQVSRQLARKKEYAALQPHIDSMKRTSRFARRRTKEETPATPPIVK